MGCLVPLVLNNDGGGKTYLLPDFLGTVSRTSIWGTVDDGFQAIYVLCFTTLGDIHIFLFY